jgi:hypothetical protein
MYQVPSVSIYKPLVHWKRYIHRSAQIVIFESVRDRNKRSTMSFLFQAQTKNERLFNFGSSLNYPFGLITVDPT